MPTLYSRDGTPYRTEDPAEVARLKSRGYSETESRPATVVEQQFHPADQKIEAVLTYIAENPAEADRIIAEEKAGRRRVGIIGEGEGE